MSEATCSVLLIDHPRLSVRFEAKGIRQDMNLSTEDLDNLAITLPLNAAAQVRHHAGAVPPDGQSTYLSDGTFTCSGDLPRITVGDGHALNTVRFYIANLTKSLSKRDLIELGEFQLSFIPTDSDVQHGSARITHVVKVVRSDRGPFDIGDIQHIRDALFFGLSFAEGGYVGIGLAEGESMTGDPYRELFTTRSTPWTTRRAWFDSRSIDDSNLKLLLNSVYRKLDDELDRTVMQRLAGIYVAACETPNVELRIAVAGVGIEMLGWHRLKNQLGQNLKGANNLNFSAFEIPQKTLTSYGIDRSWPKPTPALKKVFQDWEVPNGPEAFWRVRNKQVHPPRRGATWPDGDTTDETWRLGLEYLAVLGLKWMGYTGTFRSQIPWKSCPNSEVNLPASSSGVEI